MSGRVLFYVQHLLGVGHLKRAEILASAMATAGLDVTVALGGRAMRDAAFRGVDVAALPPASIAGEDFSTLLDGAGQPVDAAWKAARRDALLQTYRRTRPDVVLIELFPFGRRQFRFELEPLLEKIHAARPRPKVACSVRDILVNAKRPERDAETVETLRRWFDAVLVHGDPKLIPFERTFSAADRIDDLIRYTGYVAAPAAHVVSSPGADEVLVSAGGGAVGEPLLLAALAARPLTSLAGNVWRFLTGPNLPDEVFERLLAAADNRTVVERFRPDFAARLAGAALSISQAGYNTSMDLLRSGVPALVVPYETEGETEQRLRAEILAEQGLLTVVPAAGLSAQSLANGIAAALGRPRLDTGCIDLSGAARSAAIVRALATGERA